RDGVRTPMQWSAGPNAGFSTAPAEKLYLQPISDAEYHYARINVEAQDKRASSLLWWMRKIISARKRSSALSLGSITFLLPENRHVLAFIRRTDSGQVLVVANLSRFAQAVDLGLSEFSGFTPVEMFGGVPFPVIRRTRYSLSLS